MKESLIYCRNSTIKTLTTFINEFAPEHLEDVFDDFGTPFFVQKEKQYWRSYRKSFGRRLDKGEYHRLFKALLLENMQGNVSMNKDNKGDNDWSAKFVFVMYFIAHTDNNIFRM